MTTATVEQHRGRLWRASKVEGFGTWVALLVAVVVSAVLVALRTDNSLLTAQNIDIILVTAVPLGIVGIGQTVAILMGHFDLSVAAVVSLAVVLTATVMGGESSMILPAVGVSLLAGTVVGLVNGLVVTKLHVNALITTLGTSLAIAGILNSLVESRIGAVSPEFRRIGYGDWLSLPLGAWILAAVLLVSYLLLARTRTGHHLYAVGGDEESARLSGIRVDRMVILGFAIAGFCAALAGVYLASRLGSGDPGVGDRGGYALDSIAIVVLGGTVLGGGKGGVTGTIAGLLIFSVLDTVFNLLQVDTFLKSMLQGAIIIAAVASYSIRSDRPIG